MITTNTKPNVENSSLTGKASRITNEVSPPTEFLLLRYAVENLGRESKDGVKSDLSTRKLHFLIGCADFRSGAFTTLISTR